MDYKPMRLVKTLLPGRWLALAAVLLLAHAVAVSTIHTHRTACGARHAGEVAGFAMSPVPSNDGATTDPSSSCPTCQLQQGFAFEVVTYDAGREVVEPTPRADAARLRAILRASD